MPIIKLICLAGPCVLEYYLANDDQHVMFQWASKEVCVQQLVLNHTGQTPDDL